MYVRCRGLGTSYIRILLPVEFWIFRFGQESAPPAVARSPNLEQYSIYGTVGTAPTNGHMRPIKQPCARLRGARRWRACAHPKIRRPDYYRGTSSSHRRPKML